MAIRYVPEIYTLTSNCYIFRTSKLVVLKLDNLFSFLWVITACVWCVSWVYYTVFHTECYLQPHIYGFNIQTVTDWIPSAVTNTRSRVSVTWKYVCRQLISYLYNKYTSNNNILTHFKGNPATCHVIIAEWFKYQALVFYKSYNLCG